VKKESEIMKTREPGKYSYLLIGIGLAAIGGLISALLARKETRNLLRERGRQSLDYFNHQAANLRDAADEIAKRAKDFVGPHRDSVKTDTAAEKQTYQEEKREILGG
jgi:gas vesicle protein